MSMLFAVDETLAQKARIGELVLPDQGKGGISEDAADDRGKPEATRIGCMGESVQASPNFRKAHPSRASLPHSPDFQIHSPWLRG